MPDLSLRPSVLRWPLFLMVGCLLSALLVLGCGRPSEAYELKDSAPAPAAAFMVHDASKSDWSRWRWTYVGSIRYHGGQALFRQSLPARSVSYLLLTAPADCSPQVRFSGVRASEGWSRPASLVGERYAGLSLQALYQVNAGWPLSIDGLVLSLAGKPGVTCHINVYAA